MPEDIAQTVQKVIQDLVAPDLRELKVTVAANQKLNDSHFDVVSDKFVGLQKQLDQRFDAADQKADTREQKTDAQLRAIIAALGEFKAQSELNTLQAISALSERVAILEARHQ